jgi:hypothetical protein
MAAGLPRTKRTRIKPFRGSPCESRASALDDDRRFGVINHITSIQRQLPLHEAALAYTAAQAALPVVDRC